MNKFLVTLGTLEKRKNCDTRNSLKTETIITLGTVKKPETFVTLGTFEWFWLVSSVGSEFYSIIPVDPEGLSPIQNKLIPLDSLNSSNYQVSCCFLAMAFC